MSDAEHDDEDIASRAGHVTLVLDYGQVPTYVAV